MEFFFLSTGLLPLLIIYVLVRRASARSIVYIPDALLMATGSHAVGSLMLLWRNDTEATQFIAAAALFSFYAVALSTIGVLLLTRPCRLRLRIYSVYISRVVSYDIALALIVVLNLGVMAILFSNSGIAALIVSAFTGAVDTNLLDVRKAITASTQGYVFPGLIKLVRDVVSPIAITSFVLSRHNALGSKLLWLSVLCTLCSILIGGQRFPAVLLIVSLVIGLLVRQAIEGEKIKFVSAKNLKYGITVLILFYVMSQLLGRTGDVSGGFAATLWTFTALVERIFIIVPQEAEKTFQFWSAIGPTWGLSWLSDLIILLPGAADTSLSSQLHELGGGSAQGNAPLFFAIDAWLAFGWIGIPLTSLLFVLLFHVIDATLWSYRSPCNDAARIVFYLNVPLMYSPFLFLLYGGIIILPIVGWTLFASQLRIRGRRLRLAA